MSEFAEWDSFYVIVGSAAGALIGLQFVVLTLIAERPPLRAADAGAAFATPTIVHFGTALLLSAILRAPWQAVTPVAALWGFVGLSGAVYTGIVARRMRVQTAYRPVREELVISFRAALGRVRSARVVGVRGSLSRPRGLVRRRNCGAAAALHRHSQRLGRHRLPRACQQGGRERLSGAERARMEWRCWRQ